MPKATMGHPREGVHSLGWGCSSVVKQLPNMEKGPEFNPQHHTQKTSSPSHYHIHKLYHTHELYHTHGQVVQSHPHYTITHMNYTHELSHT